MKYDGVTNELKKRIEEEQSKLNRENEQNKLKKVAEEEQSKLK
jgi:hypothetical protein